MAGNQEFAQQLSGLIQKAENDMRHMDHACERLKERCENLDTFMEWVDYSERKTWEVMERLAPQLARYQFVQGQQQPVAPQVAHHAPPPVPIDPGVGDPDEAYEQLQSSVHALAHKMRMGNMR